MKGLIRLCDVRRSGNKRQSLYSHVRVDGHAMKYNANKLKAFSDHLTDLLRNEENIQGFERVLAQEIEALKGRTNDMRPLHIKPGDGGVLGPSTVSDIGIWEPKIENGQVSFVRTRNRHLWAKWADVECIQPKSDKLRVVLLGSSVARATHIDPYFNCATALQTILQSATGAQDIEVVDVARFALLLNGLRELLAPTLALKPDAYVIFTGNNWTYNSYSLLDPNKIATMLRDLRKWAPIKSYIEEVIREQTRAFVAHLGRFSVENGVPVIFVIPDFNLLDWRVTWWWQNPLITIDAIRQSLCSRALAEEALADGNLHLAAALAEEIIQIDEETSPVGFEILAKCSLKRGKIAEARRLKEKAIDNVFNLPFAQTPRCCFVVQEALRHECALHGVTLVDLPQRFEEYVPESLPGRRFFYDHCHMTVEGIRLAMASAAEKLLPLLGKHEYSWTDLNQLDFEVERRGLAQAHLAAARVNAGSGQDYEIIRYHCVEAIKHSSDVADLMWLFINAHVRQTNIKYIKEMECFLGRKGTHRYKFFNKPIANCVGLYAPARILTNEALHLPLIQALTDTLSEASSEVREAVDSLLKREHGVCSNGVDLLRHRYIDMTHRQQERDWQMKGFNFKSYGAESSFRLICRFLCPVKISLVCRVPDAHAVEGRVNLLVNGRVVHSFFVSANWETSNIVIPAGLLREGVNSIIIRWPEPNLSKEERVERVAKKLEEAGIWENFIEIFTVYGEISDFRAYVHESNYGIQTERSISPGFI
jgi:hypothetical protein